MKASFGGMNTTIVGRIDHRFIQGFDKELVNNSVHHQKYTRLCQITQLLPQRIRYARFLQTGVLMGQLRFRGVGFVCNAFMFLFLATGKEEIKNGNLFHRFEPGFDGFSATL